MNMIHKITLITAVLMVGCSLSLLLARGGGGHGGGGRGGGFGGRGGGFGGRGGGFRGGAGRGTGFGARQGAANNALVASRASLARSNASSITANRASQARTAHRANQSRANAGSRDRDAAAAKARAQHSQHGQHNHHHNGKDEDYRGYSWGEDGWWGGGWAWWGLGLFSWPLWDPLWYERRYWELPLEGINETIDDEPYVVTSTASDDELAKTLVRAQTNSKALREELKKAKFDYDTLQDQYDQKGSDDLENRLNALEDNMDAIGKNIEKLDTKVVGPIATKLHRYTPRQQAREEAAYTQEPTSNREKITEKPSQSPQSGNEQWTDWSSTQEDVIGLKMFHDIPVKGEETY